MLEAQREEFDRERRVELVHDIQRYLLDNVVARLDWVAAIDRGNRWPYEKNQDYAPWFGLLCEKGQHVAGQRQSHFPGSPNVGKRQPVG